MIMRLGRRRDREPGFAALAERRMDLKRSASRVKQSLELAMCRGDTFTGMELKQLFSHPLLRPLLERLILIGEGIKGYPSSQGQALEDYKGKLEPVRLDEGFAAIFDESSTLTEILESLRKETFHEYCDQAR